MWNSWMQFYDYEAWAIPNPVQTSYYMQQYSAILWQRAFLDRASFIFSTILTFENLLPCFKTVIPLTNLMHRVIKTLHLKYHIWRGIQRIQVQLGTANNTLDRKKRLNLTNKPRLFNCCNTDVNTVHKYKVHPKTVHKFIMQLI